MHQQNILFDLDGTLTDPRLGITRSIQYALAKLGIDEPDLPASNTSSARPCCRRSCSSTTSTKPRPGTR
jgi:phosphoglycolate phosphatase-like HAD superfamily hydrolase